MYELVFAFKHVTIPFSEFEVAVMNRLNIAPSQLHPLGWAFVKAFQFFCEAVKGGKVTNCLFFNIF
jgi:hypothetical protein